MSNNPLVSNTVSTILTAITLLLAVSTNAQLLMDQPQSDSLVPKHLEQSIIAKLKQARPELNFSELKPSPMAGVYEIKVNRQVAFVSQNGAYMISGEMYEVRPGSLVNLQEQERQRAEEAFAPERAKIMSQIKKEDMVIYTPEKGVKGFVYVFTDIDCGFCRRLHSQLQTFMDKGIEIRYLAFPRAGPDSQSASKLSTTWCSANPQETMTRFKLGENLPLAPCNAAPVADQLTLGQQVGVNGTPAIVLESGQLVPGAVSADYLAQAMGI